MHNGDALDDDQMRRRMSSRTMRSSLSDDANDDHDDENVEGEEGDGDDLESRRSMVRMRMVMERAALLDEALAALLGRIGGLLGFRGAIRRGVGAVLGHRGPSCNDLQRSGGHLGAV